MKDHMINQEELTGEIEKIGNKTIQKSESELLMTSTEKIYLEQKVGEVPYRYSFI